MWHIILYAGHELHNTNTCRRRMNNISRAQTIRNIASNTRKSFEYVRGLEKYEEEKNNTKKQRRKKNRFFCAFFSAWVVAYHIMSSMQCIRLYVVRVRWSRAIDTQIWCEYTERKADKKRSKNPTGNSNNRQRKTSHTFIHNLDDEKMKWQWYCLKKGELLERQPPAKRERGIRYKFGTSHRILLPNKKIVFFCLCAFDSKIPVDLHRLFFQLWWSTSLFHLRSLFMQWQQPFKRIMTMKKKNVEKTMRHKKKTERYTCTSKNRLFFFLL